jgi:sigma-B regulation protein RsbU (phosphoserine phosphatase)
VAQGEKRGGRVLVVDDEPAIRALLKKIIERRGYEVDDARDGAEAIDLLRDNDYDLLLIDLMMPNVSGFELVDHLAKLERVPRPAVIVITAAAESTPLRLLDPAIVHSVVRKPFDIDVVADLVDAAASARASSDAEEDDTDNVVNFPGC